MENIKDDVLLKVEHLSQHFKMGPGQELKAVDDVSFEVKKGEVFGLVGESGCGKTTTGRSIIKLYDITSGSVYFKGHRIGAGIRSYQDAIKKAKKEYKSALADLKAKQKENALTAEEYKSAVADLKEKLNVCVQEQKTLIRSAKDDRKNCEKKYVRQLKEEYQEVLAKVDGDESRLTEEEKRKYKTVQSLPKIPKLYWILGCVALFIVSLTLVVCSISASNSFNKQYGAYTRVSAVVIASDAESETTTVQYEVSTASGKTTKYEKVLEYFDEDLGASTEEQKVRLTLYYNMNDPTQIQIEKPYSTTARDYLIAAIVVAVLGIGVVVYVHERYTSARLITKIQMIFQDPIASLDPRMTVRDIIAEGLSIAGIKDKEFIDQQVYQVLDLVGLVPEHADRYPHEFSGGQRQRIGIARSVIMQPELIIADEPISALDVSIQAQVINLLNELREKLGLTILFIAHDLSVVKYFSDRIGVMYFGKMVELATSDELFENPLHPYTRSLLSAIPLPDPHYEKQRKRFVYNPLAEHDYSVDQPTMREVSKGHFVMCNQAEFERYKAQLAEKEA